MKYKVFVHNYLMVRRPFGILYVGLAFSRAISVPMTWYKTMEMVLVQLDLK
jgi:hypothetical protein